MPQLLTQQRGLSLTEVTIMLGVLAALTSTLSPTIGDYVEDARRVKASEDVHVLATTFARFTSDVARDASLERGWAKAELLVGPGASPTPGEGSLAAWTSPIDGERVARLEDHLIVNTPGYPKRTTAYQYGASGWRGAYLAGLTPDPWGRRYALRIGQGNSATLVLSAGPDGVVNTIDGPDGLVASGDDVISVVAGR